MNLHPNKMRGTYLLPLLLLALTMGCKKPEVRTAGSILAGETGNGLRTEVFDPPFTVQGGASNPLSIQIDQSLGLSMILTGYSHYQSGANFTDTYASTSVDADSSVQFLVRDAVDSIWHCETWNVDSSTHETTTYNNGTGFMCDGSRLLDTVIAYHSLGGVQEGEMINSTRTWKSGPLNFISESDSRNFTSFPTVYESTRSYFRYTPFPSSGAYLGFRYQVDGAWRYGYLKVSRDGYDLSVHAFGVEDPEFMEE